MVPATRSTGSALGDDGCPVGDELIGRLYRAPKKSIEDIVATLPMRQRANLALFCYGRAHLHEIGLAIGACCEQWALVEKAGLLGSVLFSQGQEWRKRTGAAPAPVVRRKISL